MANRSETATALARLTDFVTPQAIHVISSLGIPQVLADGPLPAEEIAQRVGANADALNRLLRFLTTKEVFSSDAPGVYGLTDMSILLSQEPLATLLSSNMTYKVFAELRHTILTGQPAFQQVYQGEYFEELANNDKERRRFEASMAYRSAALFRGVEQLVDTEQATTVADIGAGGGQLLARLLRARDGLQGLWFDLEEPLTAAQAHLQQAGVADRCTFAVGSFFETLPNGADLYTFASVLHDWPDHVVGDILRRCREVIPPAGRLVILEQLLDGAPTTVYGQDVNVMVMLGGRERSVEDFRKICLSSGFEVSRVRLNRTGVSALEAVPA
ncbi:methyltransferase [Streptomyces sp. NPDC051020]|uniref:methyltransferase n=1 Tax=Streptomyces sp. NPDC051020 TaxID=3155409 RepID=UPI00342AE00C